MKDSGHSALSRIACTATKKSYREGETNYGFYLVSEHAESKVPSMSAAQPKTITKPETRRKHRRRSRFTPKPKRQTPLVADKGEDSWYLIRGIVDEKFEKGQTYYLVDWEGTDESGQPHRPSWVHYSLFFTLAILPIFFGQASSFLPAHCLIFTQEPEQNLTIAAVNAWKDSKTFLKPTQNPSDAAVRDSNPSAQESNQAALNQEGGPTQSPSWRRQSCGTKRPREHQAIEESSISEKAPHKRQRTEYSLHTDSSRERDQDLLEVAANEPKHDDQDSSSTTPLSIEEALRLHQIVIELPQNPLFNPSEFFHLSSSSHPTNSQHSSFSIFLPHTSQSQSHDPEIRRDRHQVIPDSQEISQLTSASQSQLSTNNNRTESQLSNSQAAQIVIPFSNHHVELITQDQGRFTVYDDDSIVPDTFQSEDPHIQHNSLASSQALNELDANTRSASFSKDHVSGSFSSRPEGQLQSQSNKASSSLKAQESPTSGQYKDQRSTPRQQAAAENMDGTQPTVRSARDRLRAIREKNLGADLTELPINSVNTNQNGAQGESRTVSDADGQGAQAMEISPPNISPITPTSTVSPAFLTQSVGTAQGETPFNEPSNEPSNEQQSLVPETTQESAKEDPQIESALEESGSAVEYSVPHEEQPATLDPSTLSLSIEHDMEAISYDAIAPSLSAEDEFGPHEEDETPHNYPKSLLPDVPTGRNEYLITLPINNIMRPMYIDILLENEELMKAYNASFLVSPYEQPHPTLVSKIDEMFSRLFDICDLPLFMETIPSMTDIQLAKYLANTNAKFAFVTELLSSLAEAESDKVILILARPGQLIDFLGHVVQASGHGYIRCGSTITRPSKEHPLTVAVSSTEADASSIPEDVDVVIAFDHTYRRELLPASVWERSPLLMVLTSLCSIQHLNMRVSDQMDPLERKNVLVLASAKTMPYIENCDAKTSIGIPKVAQIFAEHITKWPDDDDFDWEPLKVPEDVFEDLHVASSQAMPEPSLAGLGTNQPPDSRKRSHDVSQLAIIVTWENTNLSNRPMMMRHRPNALGSHV